jgi:hypothetical protein
MEHNIQNDAVKKHEQTAAEKSFNFETAKGFGNLIAAKDAEKYIDRFKD